jgi:AcrR family transcriptional regulator
MTTLTGASRRGRRPQPQRRAEMQARLLDAAVECLIEVGWARTTLPEVVARAGVGRGAQVHHFPTKADLMAAVGGHLLERYRAEFAARFDRLAPDDRTIDAALDVLWEMLHGPLWTAVIELGQAARTDSAVGSSFGGFTEQVDAMVLDVVGHNFPAVLTAPFGASIVRGTVALLIGLALQTSVDGDRHGHHAEVFRDLNALCRTLSLPAMSSGGS